MNFYARERTSFFSFPLMIAFLGLVMAGTITQAHGQITFNTALPVTKGEGILRVQSFYIQSTGDPGPMDRELRVWAFPVVGVYGLTKKITLFGIAPILSKKLEVTTPMGRRTRRTGGLGDMRFLARYTAYQWDRPGQTIRFAPFAGLEVPTGEDNDRDELGPLPQTLQLGSGSWDPILGTAMTWQTLDWEFDSAVSYKFNTEANNFEFGDVARLDLGFKYRVLPREIGSGVPGFLYVVLESNLIWQGRNQTGGRDDSNSGGTTWLLDPGLQYVTRRFVAEGVVKLPVIQNLNGDALENDFTLVLSFRVNF